MQWGHVSVKKTKLWVCCTLRLFPSVSRFSNDVVSFRWHRQVINNLTKSASPIKQSEFKGPWVQFSDYNLNLIKLMSWNLKIKRHTLILFPDFNSQPFPPHVRLSSASHKRPYSVVGALLASFRPSSDINCEWMQTPVEEYGLQEACHKLAPLGRTFNLLSRGAALFQVAQLKDMHLPAFYSHTGRRFERRESIWSKWFCADCRCGPFLHERLQQLSCSPGPSDRKFSCVLVWRDGLYLVRNNARKMIQHLRRKCPTIFFYRLKFLNLLLLIKKIFFFCWNL